MTVPQVVHTTIKGHKIQEIPHFVSKRTRLKSLFLKSGKQIGLLKLDPLVTPSTLTEADLSPHQASLPYFASDEDDGLSTCPPIINTQLSLLCQERSRQLEHDILLQLQYLLFNPEISKPTFGDIYAIYTVLTLLMDAYESYAIEFKVRTTTLFSGAEVG